MPITFFKLNIFCSNFRIVRAVPETLNSGEFLFKKSVFDTSIFSILRKISEKYRYGPELVPQTPQISVLNEKTPELGVSTASKMILKIWAKNIKFEKS